jgi:hypothetical protein
VSEAAFIPESWPLNFNFSDFFITFYVGPGSKSGSRTGSRTVMHSGSGFCGSGSTTLLNGSDRFICQVKRVYYQRLQIPINELENKKQFKCLWISHNFRDEKELVLYPNRSVVCFFLLMDWLGKVVAK